MDDATGDTAIRVSSKPWTMESTPVPNIDDSDRPAYIVHSIGETPPPFAPRCPADCWCRA